LQSGASSVSRQRRNVPEQHPPRPTLGQAELPSLCVVVRIGRERRAQRGAVAELAGVDVYGGPGNLARGKVAADLDDVPAGFRLGGGKAAGEDAGPGGAPDLFGLEGGQAGCGGDGLDGAGDFGAEGDQAGAGVAAVFPGA
jgi:hypothetical protein